MLAKKRKPPQRPNSDNDPTTPNTPKTPTSKKITVPNDVLSPARINLDSSKLSLRRQLAMVRQANEVQNAEKQVIRTSFRKKKDTQKRHNEYIDASLPDGKYDHTLNPIVFVDGYNVIGVWPRLRKWRERADLETARRLLLETVAEFSAVRGWDCVVVFDAQNTDMKQRETEDDTGIKVVFTAGETADSYIERSVFANCKIGKRQVWAATSDLVHARVSGAMGAHVMSSSLFVQELKRSRKETQERVCELENDGSAHRSRMLMSAIDKTTLEQLYEMRDQLDRM